jgi:anti-sigma B factor antagonist
MPTEEKRALRRGRPSADRAIGTCRVRTTTVGYRTVVRVDGELDIGTSDTLLGALSAVLLSSERDIWIDLGGTTFIDSSGLHVLLDTRRELDRDHRRLAVVCPPGPVRRTFELCGLDAAIEIFPDRSTAHRMS